MKKRYLGIAVAALCLTAIARAQDDSKKAETDLNRDIRAQVEQQIESAKKMADDARAQAGSMKEYALQLAQVVQDTAGSGDELKKQLTMTIDSALAPDNFVTWSHGGAADLPKTRVTFDLKDTSVKDAFTTLLKMAKLDYAFSSDLPDRKITASAKDVTIGAALDLLADIGEVGWVRQNVDGKSLIKVGKNVRISSAFTLLDGMGGYGGGGSVSAPAPSGRTGVRVQIPNMRDSMFFSSPWTVTRSSFICPHCKGKVTVTREPSVVKCPKCGEVMPPNWQYCPKDGTKRPADKADWKFCPLCGKAIDVEKLPVLSEGSSFGRAVTRASDRVKPEPATKEVDK